jgi:tetratricopeptide (TPR) repeat protein
MVSLLPLAISLLLLSNDVPTIHTVKKLYSEGSFSFARDALENVLITDEIADEILYYKGLLAEDAEHSVSFYTEILEKYPKSPYSIDALYRISQYEFLRGSYKEVITMLDEITTQYPESKYFDASCYLKACSYEALSDTSSAKTWYTKVSKKDTLLYEIAQDGLSSLIKPRSIFSIQIGSFVNKESAKDLLATYDKKGYQTWLATTVKDDVKYYKVLIGEFESKERAKGFSKLFNEQEKIPFWIIKIKKM